MDDLKQMFPLILDERFLGLLSRDTPEGDEARGIFEYLAYRKTNIYTETSGQVHDAVKVVWGENSRLFHYFKDIIKRSELSIIQSQSHCDSIKDVIKLRKNTHEDVVVLTTNPELYKDIDHCIAVVTERFKKLMIDVDNEYLAFVKTLN